MPRRIGDYPDAYASWNYIMTYGSILTIISVFLFLILVYNSFNKIQKSFKFWS